MPILAIILSLTLIILGVYLFTNKDNQENIVTAKTEDILATKPEETGSIIDETTTTIQEVDSVIQTDITENEKVEEKPVAETPKPIVTNTSVAEKPPVSTPTTVSQTKTYTAEETYFVSNKKYTVDVTLDVKDGIVTNADVMYGNKETGYQHPLQERFDGAYKTQVVGKKLDNISLSRVGGASLTSKAFNEAVANIIDQTTQS